MAGMVAQRVAAMTRYHRIHELHLVMDSHVAHKHPIVQAWLAGNPRIHVDFTPTSGCG